MSKAKPKGMWKSWLRAHQDSTPTAKAFEERPGTRKAALQALHAELVGQYVGLQTILKAGGYTQAADIIANSMPSKKRIRSGDIAEVLAVEFLHATTSFTVPVKKLRFKSDRNTALHGNDVIGINTSRKRPRIVKGECKSRQRFSPSHVPDAMEQLDQDGGRPNPSTLSFITMTLPRFGGHPTRVPTRC